MTNNSSTAESTDYSRKIGQRNTLVESINIEESHDVDVSAEQFVQNQANDSEKEKECNQNDSIKTGRGRGKKSAAVLSQSILEKGDKSTRKRRIVGRPKRFKDEVAEDELDLEDDSEDTEDAEYQKVRGRSKGRKGQGKKKQGEGQGESVPVLARTSSRRSITKPKRYTEESLSEDDDDDDDEEEIQPPPSPRRKGRLAALESDDSDTEDDIPLVDVSKGSAKKCGRPRKRKNIADEGLNQGEEEAARKKIKEDDITEEGADVSGEWIYCKGTACFITVNHRLKRMSTYYWVSSFVSRSLKDLVENTVIGMFMRLLGNS